MNRTFPPKFPHQKYCEYRLDGFSKKDLRNFSEAEDSFMMQLSLIQSEENRIGRSINKGGTYFDLGLCISLQGENDKAVICFLKAYVEDALSTEIDEEDDACKGAAFNILKDYFGVKSHVISKINEKVLSIKNQGNDIKDPGTILEQVANELDIDVDTISDWVKFHYRRLQDKSYFGFPQPWEHRIFIGGSYAPEESLSLYQIKDAVRRKDLRYVPIMGSDVYIKKERIHHHTLLLLHTCKWAIFDASNMAGQLMEIERTLDYENRVLILYRSADGQPSLFVSQMISTYSNPRIEFKNYKTFEELQRIVIHFLPQFEAAENE